MLVAKEDAKKLLGMLNNVRVRLIPDESGEAPAVIVNFEGALGLPGIDPHIMRRMAKEELLEFITRQRN